MSYLALARQYRPSRFADVVGQPLVVKALQRSIAQGHYHHAILLHGTRGVGKTTLGRLIAKALNCEQPEQGEPCGQCHHCVAVQQGSFVDLVEVDAASRTRVEDTRELLERVVYPPSQGRYKVYLIDEVHMLSNHSFNALLKTLEEPPSHVKFILATTDPEKVPATILSRCLKLTLRPLPTSLIQSRLVAIADQESIDIDTQAIDLLARVADGSMRDALSLLEQARHLADSRLDEKLVASMLGLTPTEQVDQLLDALTAGKHQVVLDQIDRLVDQGVDLTGLLGQLAAVVADGLKISLSQADERPSCGYWSDAERCQHWQAQVGADRGHVWYQMLVQAQKDLSLAPSARTGFTVALLRLLHFQPVTPSELDALRYAATNSVADGQSRELSGADKVSKKISVDRVPQPRSHSSSSETPSPVAKASVSAEESLLSSTVSSESNKGAEVPVSKVSCSVNQGIWQSWVSSNPVQGMAKLLLEYLHFSEWSASTTMLTVTLSKAHASLRSERVVKQIAHAFAGHLGISAESLKLVCQLNDDDGVKSVPASSQSPVGQAVEVKSSVSSSPSDPVQNKPQVAQEEDEQAKFKALVSSLRDWQD